MADASANAPQIEGSLPLYKRPEPLNIQQHKGKGLKYGDRPFDFLSDVNLVPVTLGEIAQAGARYPIIFMGEARLPVAVMGLRQNSNLFVSPETGELEKYAYLPAYVRRYPFVAAVHKDETERFTVCVDADSHLMSDEPAEPFFTEDGQPTEFLNRAIDFVRRFEAEVATTNAFIARLKELDLFEQQQTNWQPRDANSQPVGDPIVIATYWSLSGEKLRALTPTVLAELRDNAYLGGIYAQMMSMSQWDGLTGRANARGEGPQQFAGAMNAAPPPPPQA